MLASLDLKSEVNWDYFILLVAKTGMRFSEALALTPKDFDFSHQTLYINKTWDYKGKGGFQPTKNKSSVRKIQIDWQLVIQFSELIKGLPMDQPIFVKSTVYNSTVNDILCRHCEKNNIPVISIHGLRHTLNVNSGDGDFQRARNDAENNAIPELGRYGIYLTEEDIRHPA